MKVFDGNWKAFGARTVVFGVVVFGAVRLAVARPGVAGGPARSSVTVAGTVTGLSGTQRATFHFHRSASDAGVAVDLCAPQVELDIREGGAFSVEVPLDSMMSPCPDTMFDGRDIQVDVDLPGAIGVVRNANVNPVPYAHFASVAGIARQYETPDCPAGYRNEPEGGFSGSMRLCVRRLPDGTAYDQVVRVGTGSSAFWIDRYEATVWHDERGTVGVGLRDGISIPYGAEGADYHRDFPPNGQWVGTLFALSRNGVRPSRYITWFQAQAVCRISGKKLPSGEEWLAAARGTVGSAGCHASSGDVARQPRNIGAGSCRSAWGAEDMIGNVAEWTAEWFGAPGSMHPSSPITSWPVALSFGEDQSFNVGGTVFETSDVARTGLPAAAVRGGSWRGAPQASGIFVFNIQHAPSLSSEEIGFRCVIPR